MKHRFLTFFLLTPLFIGCKSNASYTGEKIVIERNEECVLVDSNPQEMKTIAIDNQKDSVFFIGDDSCLSCKELKGKLDSWMTTYKGKIYYVPLATIADENVEVVNECTVGYYSWEKQQAVPAVYFFKKGTAVYRGDNSNTIKYLNRYVTVESAE